MPYTNAMAALSLRQLVTFLGGLNVPPEAHRVVVDGREGAVCTRARFRSVFGLSGVEFPVEYAYRDGAGEVVLESRLRVGGLGVGGRERLTVDGRDVDAEDVVVSFVVEGGPQAVVEFRWTEAGAPRDVRFLAAARGGGEAPVREGDQRGLSFPIAPL